MDFGLHLGTRGAAADPDNLARIAQHAEGAGLAYLGFSDHVIIAQSVASKYPYNESGDWPAVDTGFCLEQLSCMAYVAGLTKKIRLLTSVMVIPHRPAILAAKTIATVDHLSKGRVTLGVGVGWNREEIEAIGAAPPFDRRGAASNEYVRAFKAMWSEETPVFDGEFVKVENIKFSPKPTQTGGPPIWIGGEGLVARKRVAALGDGWYPTIRNAKDRIDEPALFAAALANVHELVREAGRDPAKIDVAMYAPDYSLGGARKTAGGARVPFTGSGEEIAADARAYRDAGVRHLNIGFEAKSLDDVLRGIDGFAKEVIARAD